MAVTLILNTSPDEHLLAYTTTPSDPLCPPTPWRDLVKIEGDMVLSGSTSATVGIQANFLNKASAEFARNLYDSLLVGVNEKE